MKIADENNKPGEFTAFCSYEFTSQYNFRNLHRNVYFCDCAKVPEQPYSALDSRHPGGSLEVDGHPSRSRH